LCAICASQASAVRLRASLYRLARKGASLSKCVFFLGKSERAKGANAEREFVGILNDALFGSGKAVKRNLDQTRDGGCDAWISVAGKPMAIEIKRQEALRINAWLDQVKSVTADLHAVAFRTSRNPWSVCLPIETFLTLIREHELEPAAKPRAKIVSIVPSDSSIVALTESGELWSRDGEAWTLIDGPPSAAAQSHPGNSVPPARDVES